MATDMLLAAEAHQGPVHKLRVLSSWEKVMAHLAVHLTEAMVDADMIREATTLQDKFLKKHKRQLPGLCYWVIISRAFARDEGVAKHYAMEELRFCKYLGNGGVASLKSFVSKFKTIITNIAEAGGETDDNNFQLRETFTAEFRRIPELKESVALIDRSPLNSKFH